MDTVLALLAVGGIAGAGYYWWEKEKGDGDPDDIGRDDEIFIVTKTKPLKRYNIPAEEAEDVADLFGCQVATYREVNEARKHGLDVNEAGWLRKDGKLDSFFVHWNAMMPFKAKNWGNKVDVWLSGLKPPKNSSTIPKDFNVRPFNSKNWFGREEDGEWKKK